MPETKQVQVMKILPETKQVQVMKILFVKPPSNTHLVIPPVGLVYIASCCKDHDVKILDCLKEKYNHEMFEEYIKKEKPDILGLTAFSMEIDSAVKCTRIAKAVDKSIITIIGGAHASNLLHNILKEESVDYALTGEVEKSFPLFLEAVSGRCEFENVPGLGYKNGGIKINKPEFVTDLDSINFPRWDLIKLNEYPRTYQSKRFPVVPLITSRGCPYHCTFCTAHTVSGYKFRVRSPENVLEEIRILYQKYKVKELSILDDIFALDRKRVEEICRLLINEKMDLIWTLPNGIRVDSLDLDLLRLMKKAGCYEVCVGIESCSDKILKDMKKSLTVEIIKEKVPLIAKAGIRATGFFILGYPTETVEDINKTIKISKKLGLHRARFFLFQPLPGSEISNYLVEQKMMPEDMEWEKFDYSKVNVLPPKIRDKETLQKLQRNAILGFYLRPHILIRYIWDNLTIDQLKELASMIKIYILHK